MKTLIFNGSPRENGDCAALLRELAACLSGETKTVSAYRDGISPCVDCRFCVQNPGCAIDDGMGEVYRWIERCDSIVIASPLHYSELSGPLLALLSRLQTYYCARRFRHMPAEMTRKRGALILTGGGDGSPEKARATALTLFKAMNAECVAEVLSHDTNRTPAALDAHARRCARDAAAMLEG